MLTYIYNAFTLSTVHSLIQYACTKSLLKSSALWADFTPWRWRESISHCLALPVKGQKMVQGARHFHGEISLSYLQMPATGRIKKWPPSAQKLCRKSPAKRGGSRSRSVPAWQGWNPHPPAPPVRAGTGHPRTCRKRQERKADLGACFTLWDPAALDAGLCFQENFLAVVFLAMTDCYEMYKQRRRRPSCLQRPLITEYTLQ